MLVTATAIGIRSLLYRAAIRNDLLQKASVASSGILSRSGTRAGSAAVQNENGLGNWVHHRRMFSRQACLQGSVNPGIEVDPSLGQMIVSRIMGPDDTQMFGNVHGGVIMQLVEEAGTILSTQYCNRINSMSDPDNLEAVTVSGCMERMDFLQPMFLGELAEVHAQIGFTSPRSIQVIATVYARNITKGTHRLTARCKLWYVPLAVGNPKQVIPVPRNRHLDPDTASRGQAAYNMLRKLRNDTVAKIQQERATTVAETTGRQVPEPFTPSHSETMMKIAMHPSHCWAGERYCRGGVAMKFMDECGALAAANHAKQLCFTASVDNIMFIRKIMMGTVMVIKSKPIFSSPRSLEVSITADEQRLEAGKGMIYERAVQAIFTFISLDKTGKPRDIPLVKATTPDEVKLFEERRKIYNERKSAESK